MPTITSSKFREYIFLTHPSPASIARLMIQRKKNTRTKKQAVRQTESSCWILLLWCLQKQAPEFAPIVLLSDRYGTPKAELCLALQVQIKPRVCQVWHVLNVVQGNAAEELPTLPPSILRGRDGAPKLERARHPLQQRRGKETQHQGKGRLRAGGFCFCSF